MPETKIIETLREQHDEYKKLYEEHKKLKEALAEINKNKYITAEEEIEKKKMQKKKLQKKDRMEEIVREFKNSLKSQS